MRSVMLIVTYLFSLVVYSVLGSGELPALGGAGYSLSFQGLSLGTDIAALGSNFDCSSYWPKNEFAVSFWAKCSKANPDVQGVSCRSLIFIQGYDGVTYDHVFSPLVSVTNTTFSSIVKGTNTVKHPVLNVSMYDWHHYLFQISNTTFNVTIDGVSHNNATIPAGSFDLCPSTSKYKKGVTINIGRNFFQPSTAYYEEGSGFSYEGQLDEFSIWNRTLTQQEIANMQRYRLRGDEAGLVLYYDMDTPGRTVRNLAFTGSKYDLLLGQTIGTHVVFDVSTNTRQIMTIPTFAPSTVPVEVPVGESPLLVFPVPFNASMYPLTIARPTAGSVLNMTSLPTWATIWNTDDGVNPTDQLGVGTVITHSEGIVLYQVLQPFNQTDNFTLDVDAVPSFVSVLSSTTPTTLRQTVVINSEATVSLVPGAFDNLGLFFTNTIVTFPSAGTLYQYNPRGILSDPITPQSPNITHKGGMFAFTAPKLAVSANFLLEYVTTNEAGVRGNVTAILFKVVAPNYLPTVIDASYNVTQNTEKIIDLVSSDQNGDVVSITISSRPQHGKLYYVLDDGTRGAEITSEFNPYLSVTQNSSYASEVLAVSSWYSNTPAYSPLQTLHAQDVFASGDSTKSICFLTRGGIFNYQTVTNTYNNLTYTYSPDTWYDQFGYTEFLEWEFDFPMYAVDVVIGINRGPGSVVNIKAWSPLGWKSIYSGAVDKTFPAKTYQYFSPEICQTPYSTQRIRAEFNTRDLTDWTEVDYVQLSGTAALRMGALEWNKTRVMYVPDVNYFGNDSFKFAANDCPYDKAHTSPDAQVTLTVVKTALPPIIETYIASSGAFSPKPIQLEASNTNQDPISNYTILSLPKIGQLTVFGQPITSVPYNFSGSGLSYKPDLYAWDGEQNVSFQYTAATALPAAGNATAWIVLQQPGAENPVLAYMVLFLTCVNCGASYVLLLTRYDKYPLRTYSLILSLLITTATALSINIPLSIILYSQNYNCSFYFWSYMLFPSTFFYTILVAIYRQHNMFRLEKTKKKLSREGNQEDVLEMLKYYKEVTSEKRMALFGLAGVIVFIVIAAGLNGIANSTVGNFYCHSPAVILNSILIYWIFGLLSIGGALYYTRRDFEFTGFRREIFSLLAYGFVLGVLYILLLLVSTQNERYNSFALLLAVIPNIYQFAGVLRPSYLTFAFLRKQKEEEGLEPLGEVIITTKGFAWFLEFCLAEFSQESPLCWRAIQQFKVKTSYQAMKDIYTKYFAPNAPLAVNLSSRSIKELQTVCPSKTEETPLQELQSIFNLAQVELLHLMQEDSYLRFVASPYYKKYKKGEKVPRRDDGSGKDSAGTDTSSQGKSKSAHPGGSSASKSGADKNNGPATEMVTHAGSGESKGTAVDPLTGGWSYDIEESGRPVSPLTSTRELPEEGYLLSQSVGRTDPSSPSVEPRTIPENEEEALKNSLVFNSNPLRKLSLV